MENHMTDIYTHISAQIKKLRGDQSQEAMAKRLGIATNTLSRWETGTYKPTAEDLNNMARACQVPIETFFPENNDKATEERAQKVKALTSALGGLGDTDFEEVINYAQYRKAHMKLQAASPTKRRKKA
jgi:transcriptional regulator with XRE-family HTH domain